MIRCIMFSPPANHIVLRQYFKAAAESLRWRDLEELCEAKIIDFRLQATLNLLTVVFEKVVQSCSSLDLELRNFNVVTVFLKHL